MKVLIGQTHKTDFGKACEKSEQGSHGIKVIFFLLCQVKLITVHKWSSMSHWLGQVIVAKNPKGP